MFGGSIYLFSFAGTAVRLHPTFFLLLAWIAAMEWMAGGPAQAAWGLAFITLLFVCVVLHEFGHIFAARRYGIRTPDVTLFPFGGVAALERMPERPAQEIAVALAGPAVNAVIAVVLLFMTGGVLDLTQVAGAVADWRGLIGQVLAANVVLAVFNLLPAFPMDGGRVLRALLTLRLGYARATRVAATIGQGLAVLLAFVGLLGNPLLVLVAIFIFMAAASESGMVQARDLTRGHLAGDAMITHFERLGPQSSVDDAAELLLRTTQQELPVVDGGGGLRGMVSREQIVAALRGKGGRTPVLEIMSTDVPIVSAATPLETVFPLLSGRLPGCVGVTDGGGRLIGYVSRENLSELMLISSSRREATQRIA